MGAVRKAYDILKQRHGHHPTAAEWAAWAREQLDRLKGMGVNQPGKEI